MKHDNHDQSINDKHLGLLATSLESKVRIRAIQQSLCSLVLREYGEESARGFEDALEVNYRKKLQELMDMCENENPKLHKHLKVDSNLWDEFHV